MSEPAPLILASTSVSRRNVLAAAGVPFEIVPSNVDEDALKTRHAGIDHSELALILARAKASAVSRNFSGRLVLGCDQLLVLGAEIFDKPEGLSGAESHLRKLSGKTHRLLSAAVLLKGDETVWQTVDIASLTMRPLSDTYISAYLEREGEAVLTSVGAYRLEGLGAQLFSEITGDHFTILGLPLLALLAELRSLGVLES